MTRARVRSVFEAGASAVDAPINLMEAGTLPRYVELIRVSTAGQAQRDTPADQRAALDKLAITRPGRLVERIEIGADGLSGGEGFDNRPDLRRLVRLAIAKAFDEIRVRHYSRLTRHPDPRERAIIPGIALDAGAVIVEADTGEVTDPRTMAGGLMAELKGWFSAREREDIRQKTHDARARLIREGTIVHGRPWGRRWDKAARTWRVDAKIVATLRAMALDILAGRTAGEVAAGLNAAGIPTPRGSTWHRSHVCRTLRLSNMIGRMPDGIGGETTCPPILDEPTWRAMLARLESNATRSGPPRKIEALLRGIATCATCGAAMYVNASGTPGKNGNGRIHYYGCSAALRTGEGLRAAVAPECRRLHRLDAVDAAVRERLAAVLADPARLLDVAREGRADRERRDPAEAQREIDDLDARAERLARLHTTGRIPDAVADRQYAEIARLRAVADRALAAALAEEVAATRAAAEAGSLDRVVAALRSRVDGGGFGALRAALVALFPSDDPRCYFRIAPDGTLDAMGLIPLDGGAPPSTPPDPGTRRNAPKSPASIRPPPLDEPGGSKAPPAVIPMRLTSHPKG